MKTYDQWENTSGAVRDWRDSEVAKEAWNACAQAIFEELNSRGLYGAHLALAFQDYSLLETPDD